MAEFLNAAQPIVALIAFLVIIAIGFHLAERARKQDAGCECKQPGGDRGPQ